MTVIVDREAVLAHRAAAHGLHRRAARAADVPGLDLGVQDTPPGAARLALAARVATPDAARDWAADADLTLAWTTRGAPHVHRRDDLLDLAAALWPADDADATARLAAGATRVRAAGLPPRDALRLTTDAVADVVATLRTRPAALDTTGLDVPRDDDGRPALTKGLLSREVTRRLPEELRHWCRVCAVHHVSEQLLRLAALPGGLAIAGSAPLTFTPLVPWPGVPHGRQGFDRLVRAYLRRYAPAAPGDVKAFFSASPAAVAAAWPADAIPVEVAGSAGGRPRRAFALPEEVDGLADPPEPPAVRLLPPGDAFLKAGDRGLLVPDRAEQKLVWRVLGSPGVLLVDAMPAGVWRPAASGRRLEVRLELFAGLDPAVRADVDAEAERLAAVRGLALGRVTVS